MRARLLLLLSMTACLSKPGFEGGDAGTLDGIPDAADPEDRGLLAVGAQHACATSRGRLYCWGSNDLGQLGGAGPSTGTPREVRVSGATVWEAVVAGDDHTCGLHDGVIDCWGSMDSSSSQDLTRITLPGGAQPRSLHAGGTASCAIDTQGRLFCWGRIHDLSLAQPTPLSPGGHASEWTSVALAADHACALRADGTAWCWGDNDRNQLGGAMNGQHGPDEATVLGDGLPLFDALTVERDISCGITRAPDRRLLCVGAAVQGVIYPSSDASSSTPVLIGGTVRTWAAAELAPRHACGISNTAPGETRSVVCFGHDTDGALGNAFSRDPSPAVVLGAPTEPTKVATGDHLSCARNATQVMCWGANRAGELGNGQIASSLAPHLALSVSGVEQVHAIVTGIGHTCAIVRQAPVGSDQGGTVYCWGDNRQKQVDWTVAEEMVTAPHATSVIDATVISTAAGHTCAHRATSQIECWGDNSSRQLGTDNVMLHHHVLPSPTGQAWRSVTTGSAASCAVTQEGKLHCWGVIAGINLVGPELSLEATGDAWHDDVTFGSGVVVGSLRRQGTDRLAAFGQRCPVGGAATTSQPHVPFLYSTRAAMPEQIQLAASTHACMRLLENGLVAVYCAGNNQQGQITGVPTGGDVCKTETLLAPPDNTEWARYFDDEVGIAVGPAHSCALVAADGLEASRRIACWGTNAHGAMGTLPVPSRPAVVADLHVREIATAERHTCVITGDRKGVYCWGDNRYGEVGNGARFHERPVDVQFP